MIAGILIGLGFILIGEIDFRIRKRNKDPGFIYYSHSSPTMRNPYYARGMWWVLGIIALAISLTS